MGKAGTIQDKMFLVVTRILPSQKGGVLLCIVSSGRWLAQLYYWKVYW